MLLSIEGQEKTVKTTFAYTAPLPIVGFPFDLGHDRAINGKVYDKYFKDLRINTVKMDRLSNNKLNASPQWDGYDITIYELPQPIQLDSNAIVNYMRLWDYFIALAGESFSDNSIPSVVLDTATVARGVKTNAYIEELNSKKKPNEANRKQLLQIEYGHVNSAFENIYTIAKAVNKNLIAVHHLRDEYKPTQVRDARTGSSNTEERPSGLYELDGWNKTYRFVDVAIRNRVGKFTKVIDSKPVEVTGPLSQIVVCGENLDLVGTELPEMDWNMLVDLISMSLSGRKEYGKRELK